MMLFDDGLKLIVDDTKGTQELNELARDPKELVNLIDEPTADAPRRVATLRRFFATQAIQKPGYTIPKNR